MEFEYLFFDEAIARRFCEACARETGLEPQLKETDGQWLAQLPESVSDTHMDTVEALYETFFFGEQAEQIEASEAHHTATGMQIQLADGRFTTVLVEPELMNRLLSVLTIDELNRFLHDVASAVENPNGGGSVCEVLSRQKDGE